MANGKVRYIERQEADRVRDFFNSMKDDFEPSLDRWPKGIEPYLSRSLDNGRVAVYEQNGEILAATMYWLENGDARASFTAVAKDQRTTPILYTLLEEVIKREDRKIGKVRTRVNSNNTKVKRLLQTLGFKLTKAIRGEVSSDRISEYYEADFSDIKKFFTENE